MENIDLSDLKGKEKTAWKKAIKEQHSWTDFEKLKENSSFMVHEDNWEDFAYDEIHSLWQIPDYLDSYIDYAKWSDDLFGDYTEIEVDGEIYYFRGY
jgi:antirestriction protein